MAKRRFDVVLATDCHLPGGTAQSVANEARAQAAQGITTGLVAVRSNLSQTATAFAPAIQKLLDEQIVTLIDPSDTVSCDVAILRHPQVAATLDPARLPKLHADHQLLIVNQAPSVPLTLKRRDKHTRRFDVDTVNTAVASWLGATPTWCPISPLVRDDMRKIAPGFALAADDWVNVIDPTLWRSPRNLSRRDVPVMGRHSRDDILKWPEKHDLFKVYPTGEEVEVAVLGGLDALDRIVGDTPKLWRTYPFGTVPVKTFLGSLDVYVYFHHPAWVEAFGRTVLEALASGLPTVLPHHFQPLFGDGAVYSDVDGVAGTVAQLTGDKATYTSQVDAAHTVVAERFSYQAHLARLTPLLSRPLHPPASHPTAVTDRPTTRRVLFVSSNGAGVGHLMRLMAYAKQATDTIEPVFLTLSQGVKVVDDAGYLVEYLPSRGVTNAPARDWHPHLRDRLVELFARYDIDTVVFDGTWPYQGLLDALLLCPDVTFVWSRRALWKKGVKNPFLTDPRGLTDLVVEPGDAAESHDVGATVRLRASATRVTDVRFVDDDEMLNRTDARTALQIDPDVTAVLVHLGAGNINDTSHTLGRLVSRLANEGHTAVYVTRSIIANDAGATYENVHGLSVYPLAKYLPAFDYAFAASGYNSFHEMLAAGVPCGWVANTDTATDDQAARARYAAHVGIGVDVTGETPEQIDAAVTRLSDAATRERMRERMRQRHQPNGAAAAMQAIETATMRTRRHSMAHLFAPPASGLGALLPVRLRRTFDGVRAVTRAATYRQFVARRLKRLPVTTRKKLVGMLPASLGSRVANVTGLGGLNPLPLSDTAQKRRVMVVCDDTHTDDTLAALTHTVATVKGDAGCDVLMVLRRPAFTAIRQYGLVAEYIPDASRFARVQAGDTLDMMLADRLESLRRRYAITGTVTLAPNLSEAEVLTALRGA